MVFAPGGNFYIDPAKGDDSMRLNFASNTEDVIVEGIKRLGRAARGCRSDQE
jgi:GntR family transcriptional regulator/MocR family aminotransferase